MTIPGKNIQQYQNRKDDPGPFLSFAGNKDQKADSDEYKQDGRKIETVQVIIQRLDQQAQVKQ
ncbi:hypothetical protein ACRQ5D_08300 [Mucilaginibacter sp. P25]|uniref:hypothetical protein n=1 Tax=Mucilaginibacter sp. P25 TaxID=3423945 RepID=UPI003D7BCAD3